MIQILLVGFLFAFVTHALPVSQWRYKGISLTNGLYCKVKFDTERASQAVLGIQRVDNITSPVIFPTETTATFDEIRAVVARIREAGMQVMLKPHINVQNKVLPGGGDWRGEIGTNFTDSDWRTFFRSYERFIVPYARLAAELRTEVFSLGCELVLAAKAQHTAHWARIAQSVRAAYPRPGVITYAANHGEPVDTQIFRLPEVDAIGVDAYYLIKNPLTATFEQRVAMWETVFERGGIEKQRYSLRALHEKLGKPVLFTELGYCSANCSGNVGQTPDARGQAEAFRAMFAVATRYDWFLGLFHWQWYTDPAAVHPRGFTIWPNKPAYWLFRERFGTKLPPVAPPQNLTALC